MYSNDPDPATGQPVIRGRTLAHQQWSATRRALLAADFYRGRAHLKKPTVRQVARLCGVSEGYVHAALKLDDAARVQVENSHRPLVEAKQPPHANGLLIAWNSATPNERVDLARIVGPARIWDEALAPAIS
jgi:hypothetical protein